MSIIIFSGSDNVGKTTIAKQFASECRYNYCKASTDKGILKRKYNPELSFIYETKRVFDLVEQCHLNPIVFDRDWPDEMVYGPHYRQEEFTNCNINDFFIEYDKRSFYNGYRIIFCYKTDYKEFADEYITISEAKEIQAKFISFFDSTYTPVLFLDTTNENIVEQIQKIKAWNARYSSLEDLNRQILSQPDFPSSDDINYDIYSSVNLPGIFYDNEILFVGQNPGQPYAGDTLSQHMHQKYEPSQFNNDDNRRTREFMYAHHQSYRQSKFYKFIDTFAKELGLLSSKQWSFTNVVKYATYNNAQPLVTLGDINTLKTQIKILDPKRIISFGAHAHNALKYVDIKHEAYSHPSAQNYSSVRLLK